MINNAILRSYIRTIALCTMLSGTLLVAEDQASSQSYTLGPLFTYVQIGYGIINTIIAPPTQGPVVRGFAPGVTFQYQYTAKNNVYVNLAWQSNWSAGPLKADGYESVFNDLNMNTACGYNFFERNGKTHSFFTGIGFNRSFISALDDIVPGVPIIIKYNTVGLAFGYTFDWEVNKHFHFGFNIEVDPDANPLATLSIFPHLIYRMKYGYSIESSFTFAYTMQRYDSTITFALIPNWQISSYGQIIFLGIPLIDNTNRFMAGCTCTFGVEF